MAPYTHVIWDWNGTLLDDTAVVVEVMNGLLTARSLPALTPDRYREIFTFPVRQYYAAIGFDLAAEPFEVLAAEWVERFGSSWRSARLRHGAEDVLGEVARRGLSQSLLSAAEQALLREQAAYFNIAAAFHALVGIDDHHAESKVEHGRRWLTASGIDPSAVLLVGDTVHDHEVAAALGVDVVLFSGGHQSGERLSPYGAPDVDSLEAVLALLD